MLNLLRIHFMNEVRTLTNGKSIKVLILDVDGTLTDGQIYMGTNGEVMKSFHVKDGYALHEILRM